MKQGPSDSAVALKYSGAGAPRLTAKGKNAIAENILRVAKDNGVPLHKDPQLAALLSRVDLGAEIPRELYVAVAEVIAFAYAISGKTPPAQVDETVRR